MVRINMKKFLNLILVLILALFVLTPLTPVTAGVNCTGNNDSCGPNATGDTESCSSGDSGAYERCCYDPNGSSPGGCSMDPDAPCGNCDWFCDPEPEPVCECSPVTCPPGNPATKFMKRSEGNGNGRTCGDPCSPDTFACPPSHFNSMPSCSVVPPSIEMSREDVARQINLTATDADYGDTVVVTKVRVIDIAGNLKSCVNVLTLGGGAVDNLTVFAGTDNPAITSQTTGLLVDAREARGIYENVNGQSLCSGFIEIEIRDIDSDGIPGPDKSDWASCRVKITVTNEAPTVSNITVKDADEKVSIRDMGATGNGNLVDGRNRLFVGSAITTQTKMRAAKCDQALAILDPIKCPGGGEKYEAFSQRRNPLQLEFTVTDGNGLDDIVKAGVWVQRSSQNRNVTASPVFSNGNRNSFSLTYSEAEIASRLPSQNSLLCFKSTAAAPEVRGVAPPFFICPPDCSACAKKEGIVAVQNNPNALQFKIGLYFNDRDSTGAQGMLDEEYSVFLSAVDKVNVPLYHVTGRGPNGWLKFTKNGVPCTGASCPANSDFSLLYDPVAPTATFMSWSLVGLTGVKTTFNIQDKAGGSGVAGVTNRYMVKQGTLDGESLGDRRWVSKVPGGSDYNGANDMVATSVGLITLEGDQFSPSEEVIAGFCAFDNAGNMRCKSNNDVPYIFLAPWLKTSFGDIYSAKSISGDVKPFSQTLPTDGSTNDNTKSIYSPFTTQVFTVGTGLMMTGGSVGQGIGVSGGHIELSVNKQLGFQGHYRTGEASTYNVWGYNPFSPGNEYERLRSSAILNCELMNTAEVGVVNCQNGGSLASIGSKPFNVIYANNAGTISNISCKRTNVIFVTGALTITGNVIKDAAFADSGCIFVLANGATLSINDTPSDAPRVPAGDGLGSPTVDKFEAAIVANAGATVQITKGARGATTKSTDRLELRGWLYSASTLPTFKRDLAPVDNRRYPAEYIIYDARLLDLFRPLLGSEKTVDLICGTSEHILCKAN